jgi:hypothetical protein
MPGKTRGKTSNNGYDADGIGETEVDHFMKCPACGEWFDMRDLKQVLMLIHEAEIEVVDIEGPSAEKPVHQFGGAKHLD